MDKNIAALLREDARTLYVSFDAPPIDELEEDEAGIRLLAEQGQLTAAAAARKITALNGKRASKTYTYVSHFELKRGDRVIVEAGNEVKIAVVMKVDDTVNIEPSSTIAYKWVISKIDMDAYEENMGRNAKIEMAVADAYRNNLRRSFSAQILAGVPDEQRLAIESLLKP